MTDSLLSILISRDGMNPSEAADLIAEAKERVRNGGSLQRPGARR